MCLRHHSLVLPVSLSIASSSTQYEEPWQEPDKEMGEAFENEFGISDTRKPIEPSAPPLSAVSSSEDLNITASNTLGEEEEKGHRQVKRDGN